MAVLDALKLLKFNKVYTRAWATVWEQVKTPPGGDDELLAHLCFVGTLIYAVRYQVALNVGMDDNFAKSLAVLAVGKAGYDQEMEDEIFRVFSAEADEASREYADELNACLAGIVKVGKDPQSSENTLIREAFLALRSHYQRLRA